MAKSVVPLESDPAIFTRLGQKLGMAPSMEFIDIYSISDPDLKSFIPRPVKAVILLFPIDKNYEDLRKKGDEIVAAYSIPESTEKEYCYWFPQRVRNACGLHALLHCLCNTADITPDSKLAHFLSEVKTQRDFDSRNKLIEQLEDDHNSAAQDGQTAAPSADDNVDLHFTSFVAKNGKVYELDGRRKGPIDLGECSGDLLEAKSVESRIQLYMNTVSEANKLRFSLMGLVDV